MKKCHVQVQWGSWCAKAIGLHVHASDETERGWGASVMFKVMGGSQERQSCSRWWERGVSHVQGEGRGASGMFNVMGEGRQSCSRWWERWGTSVMFKVMGEASAMFKVMGEGCQSCSRRWERRQPCSRWWEGGVSHASSRWWERRQPYSRGWERSVSHVNSNGRGEGCQPWSRWGASIVFKVIREGGEEPQLCSRWWKGVREPCLFNVIWGVPVMFKVMGRGEGR